MDPRLITRGVLHGVPCVCEVIVELYRTCSSDYCLVSVRGENSLLISQWWVWATLKPLGIDNKVLCRVLWVQIHDNEKKLPITTWQVPVSVWGWLQVQGCQGPVIKDHAVNTDSCYTKYLLDTYHASVNCERKMKIHQPILHMHYVKNAMLSLAVLPNVLGFKTSLITCISWQERLQYCITIVHVNSRNGTSVYK